MANATSPQFTFKTPPIPRKYYRKSSSDRLFDSDHWKRSLDLARPVIAPHRSGHPRSYYKAAEIAHDLRTIAACRARRERLAVSKPIR
jgi:hypothetical protein